MRCGLGKWSRLIQVPGVRSLSPAAAAEIEMGLPTDVYVKDAANRLSLKSGVLKSILHPDRELTVSLVLPLDNGEIGQFTGRQAVHFGS